jgi:hypothetical protein
MDHIKILKRAFTITWSYRVLWVFGFLLALTLPRNGGSSNSGVQFSGNDLQGFSYRPGITPQIVSAIVTAGLVLLCVFLLLAIAATIVRYISETALIRMVDMNEASGEQVGVRAGFRLGWSFRAFRLFLIDLLFGLAGFLAFLLLVAVAAAPFLVWLTNNPTLHVMGTVLGIGLIFLVILFFILVAIILSVVMHFIRRSAVLGDLGVFESIGRGFVLVRQRLGDIVIMALIMFAIGLGWIAVSIPFFILLLMIAVVLGGLPALMVGMLASLFSQGALPWIVAILVGLPIFLLVLIIPGSFVGGLYETFKSSTWTLTYREVLALIGSQPAADEPLTDLEDGAAA